LWRSAKGCGYMTTRTRRPMTTRAGGLHAAGWSGRQWCTTVAGPGWLGRSRPGRLRRRRSWQQGGHGWTWQTGVTAARAAGAIRWMRRARPTGGGRGACAPHTPPPAAGSRSFGAADLPEWTRAAAPRRPRSAAAVPTSSILDSGLHTFFFVFFTARAVPPARSVCRISPFMDGCCLSGAHGIFASPRFRSYRPDHRPCYPPATTDEVVRRQEPLV